MRNKGLKRKLSNILLLGMLLAIVVGIYYNIFNSKAENVLEIQAMALDSYGYLEDEELELIAKDIGDGLYEIEFPKIINGKVVNQISAVTLVKQETVTDAVITLDLNPSIQITVDEDGNVSSVYGNNDEGKMIIIDIQNELVGKKYDYALNLIIEAETECGFFVKATSNEEYNNLKITIDTEASEQQINAIEQEIKTHVEEKLTELDVIIKDKITTVKNNTKDALINKLLSLDETLNKDELNEKTHEELVKLIAAYNIERINFPTEDLVNMYNNFKEYEINIAESRIFQNFVTTSSALNEAIINNYNKLFNLVQEALTSLKSSYEEVFINEESSYNKAYNEVLAAKAEVLALRSEVEALEDGLEKTLKLAELSAKETALLTAESGLQFAKQAAESALNFVTTTINQALAQLDSYIMSTEDLQNLMNQNANELSQKLNTEKAEYLAKFEAEYKDQITAKYNKLVEQKAQLVAQLKGQE